MRKQRTFVIYPIVIMAMTLLFTGSCKKEEEPPSSSKKDPLIMWANPPDIGFGTLLSANQLNATVDVPGTFVYTPAIGTKLNVGANQDLKVNFTPADAVTYNSVAKTVKINVIDSAGTVSDIDGNVYHTVTIGSQVWMVENLKTTRYNDGIAIPWVKDGTAWYALSTPGYCWYNNAFMIYKNTYGALYNWYAVNTGKLAPAGWHVATDDEWTVLTEYLGGKSVAGGKMKSTGTIEASTGLWSSPNTGATNESGFTAVPGGSRYPDGAFFDLGSNGIWWSSSEAIANAAWHWGLTNNSTEVYRINNNKNIGNSVRCVRN